MFSGYRSNPDEAFEEGPSKKKGKKCRRCSGACKIYILKKIKKKLSSSCLEKRVEKEK
jgi:hypothetical protein